MPVSNRRRLADPAEAAVTPGSWRRIAANLLPGVLLPGLIYFIRWASNLVSRAFPTSVIWIAACVLGATLSLIELRTEGGVQVWLRVTWVTAAFVALVWLPPMLRIISLTGGKNVLAPAGFCCSFYASCLASVRPTDRSVLRGPAQSRRPALRPVR
jgi:hypothetical protein